MSINADILYFFRAWLQDPRGGAGTGVFTRALLKQGLNQEDLGLIEHREELIHNALRELAYATWTKIEHGRR